MRNITQPTRGGNSEEESINRRKNEIRNTIKTYFTDRDCSVLFRPIGDEKKLRDVQSIPYDSLRPQFRYQLEELIKKVFSKVGPKVIDGQSLNGQMFCELADSYV